MCGGRWPWLSGLAVVASAVRAVFVPWDLSEVVGGGELIAGDGGEVFARWPAVALALMRFAGGCRPGSPAGTRSSGVGKRAWFSGRAAVDGIAVAVDVAVHLEHALPICGEVG